MIQLYDHFKSTPKVFVNGFKATGIWYAEKIASQMEENPSQLKPIDLKLSVMKPLGARWMIQLYDHFKSTPKVVVNGFKATGIFDCVKS